MTLREKICEAGVSTLREYMCLENTGGTGDIIINSELITVTEDAEITVTEYSDKLVIIEDEIITLIEIEDVDTINEEDEDKVNVIC